MELGMDTACLRPLRLGSLTLDHNIVLAPLCGCTNLPTRLLAREAGAALVFPEMAKSEAVVRQSRKTQALLYFEEHERPVGIQICGGDPAIMAESARAVTRLKPDLIDINMGCPVKKIIASEAGCALLKDPARAEEVIAAVVQNTHLPVTVKMRAGWDENSLKHRELARAAERAGAAAVTLHARTRMQLFSGPARWQWIRDVKEAVGIPVIGNGDLRTPADVARMFRETGCDGVMIGRAALGNPWIFRDILHYLRLGVVPVAPAWRDYLRAMMRHFELMVRVEGSSKGVRVMREHACWYVKGCTGAAALRDAFHRMQSADDFYRIVRPLLQDITLTAAETN